ncbi:MAG: biotin/lipoyl-containing protein [Candidatus Xenobia bacterium]
MIPPGVRRRVRVGDEEVDVVVVQDGESVVVHVGERRLVLDWQPDSVLLEGHALDWQPERDARGRLVAIWIEGRRVPTELVEAGSSGGKRKAAAGVQTSPMNGTVVKILHPAGEVVAEGAPVLVLEAMKMENELRAPIAGTIARVMVAPGQTVAPGDPLYEIEK